MDTTNRHSGKSSCSWPASEQVIEDQQHRQLYETCLPVFTDILEQEQLGAEVLDQFNELYLPLAAWLAQKHSDKPVVIGINGAQGSGKSTLSKLLKSLLSAGFNKSVIHLSLDDLYLSRQHREQLASEIHPLLSVRGVPGTHDVALGEKILSKLTGAADDLAVQVPRFNKAEDDLYPPNEWYTVTRRPDIILFEGWCVGSQEQHESELLQAINELEQSEDPDASWRNYVNRQLAEPYQSLFSHIDYLLMLKVPDMASVFEWRGLQEKKLAASCVQGNQPGYKLMTAAEISRFIMHYERITRATLHEMPGRADVLLELNKQHQIDNVEIKVR